MRPIAAVRCSVVLRVCFGVSVCYFNTLASPTKTAEAVVWGVDFVSPNYIVLA